MSSKYFLPKSEHFRYQSDILYLGKLHSQRADSLRFEVLDSNTAPRQIPVLRHSFQTNITVPARCFFKWTNTFYEPRCTGK